MTTRDEAIRAYGEQAAINQIACESMTAREQAEAAWTPTSPYSVDELEDLIRDERGLPRKHTPRERPAGSRGDDRTSAGSGA